MKIKVLFGLLLLLSACESGMDRIETGTDTEESVYSDRVKTLKVMTNLYAKVRVKGDNGTFNGFPGNGLMFLEAATDNCIYGGQVDHAGGHTHSTLTASGAPLGGSHPWQHFYQMIRNANVFLKRVDSSPLSEAEKVSAKSQVRFLRAVYYHELFRWYGAVVITTDLFEAEDLTKTRATLDETINFIVKEFTEVAAELPVSYENDIDYGRATRGAALAFKARTLLYAASPLNNPTQDRQKWVDAQAACKAVMDLGIYKLYYDEDASTTVPGQSFAHNFVKRKEHQEHIYMFLRGASSDLYSLFPTTWNGSGTVLGCMPTQNLVDAFDMKDGTEPITGYDANGAPIINPESKYNDQNPYANRDPRLDMTVLRQGATWPLVDGGPKTLMLIPGAPDVVDAVSNKSGYFVCKFMDNKIDHRKSTTNQNFPMMRYAEILLAYAEIANELGDIPTAIEYVNMIRERAGVGLLKEAEWQTKGKDLLRTRIQKEWRVEFAFEEHRFFDARRWNKAEDWFSKPVWKISVSAPVAKPVYTRSLLETRVFAPRFYRLAIPQREVDNSPGITQNPGW